jgi:hypothetical protein
MYILSFEVNAISRAIMFLAAHKRGCFPALLVLFLAAQLPVSAQDTRTRFELGAEYSTIEQTQADRSGVTYSGFGGRFDWNLSRRLALESQVDFFPENGAPLLLIQGGQTLEAVFGVRAKVVQTNRLSVFGLIRPGVLHFSAAGSLSGLPNATLITEPLTHFVLNLGGGLEYYPSPRWVLRFDIEGNPYRVAAHPVSSSGGTEILPGKINDTTRLSFGVGYRIGALVENEHETKVPGNWEFGPLFSTLVIAREGVSDNVRTESGFGGYFSYRFYGVFYADADLLYFPQTPGASGPHDGGTILEGLAGVKAGIRRNRFGFFGKARPGFNSYSAALTGTSSSGGAPVSTYARSTNLVLDLGGILEFYPSEKGTLRLEVGDTHLFFSTKDVNVNGVVVPAPGGKLQHSIQMMVGYGWRF